MFYIVFSGLFSQITDCAAAILWSMYCPSLKETRMVSGATGFLDFVSYVSAAGSSTLFANAASTIGWERLILIWLALMLFGVIIALPYNKIFKTVNRGEV